MKFPYFYLCTAVFLIGATTVSAGDLQMSDPGFESGDLAGWSTFGQGWRISTDEDAQSGSSGAVNDVLASDADEWRGVYQNIPIAPGKTYSAEVSIRAVNVHTSSSWLELQWLDKNGKVISQLQSPPVTEDQPFSVMELEHVYAPPGTVSASVRGVVNMSAKPESDAEFHIFDDFRIRTSP